MIQVMIAVNNEQGNPEDRINGLQIDELELVISGDPIPCQFHDVFRKWGWNRDDKVHHARKERLYPDALFVLDGHRALSHCGRSYHVGNRFWDMIYVDDRHVTDLVAILAYLQSQYWTCESAWTQFMRAWDLQDWNTIRSLLLETCGEVQHIHES